MAGDRGFRKGGAAPENRNGDRVIVAGRDSLQPSRAAMPKA